MCCRNYIYPVVHLELLLSLCVCYNRLVGDTTPMPPELSDPVADEAQFANEPHVQGPVYMDYGTQVKIGRGTFVNAYSTWIDTCDIHVGERVLFGPHVSLYSGTHPLDPQLRDGLKGPESGKEIHIGDDCWIGGNVTILPGITIGRGTTVGAGSVVTKVHHTLLHMLTRSVDGLRHVSVECASLPSGCGKPGSNHSQNQDKHGHRTDGQGGWERCRRGRETNGSHGLSNTWRVAKPSLDFE